MSIEEEARAATVDAARGYIDDGQYFSHVATMWSAIVGAEITPIQVCLMMIALKITRINNSPLNRDSLVDIIGYAMCLEREQNKHH